MKRFHVRRLASVAALALSAGVLVSSGTAQSATGDIDYSCRITEDFSYTFKFDQNTTIAPKIYAGKAYTYVYSAKTKFPEAGVFFARSLGVTSIKGAIDATVLVNGKPVAVRAPIPDTPVPSDTNEMQLIATGPILIKVPTPGAVVLKPSNIKFSVTARTASNPNLFTLNKGDCTMAPNTRTMNTSAAIKSPTAITPAVVYNKATKKVAASATIARTSGVPTVGKVTFTLFKGTAKLRSVVATVAANKASAAFLNVRAKGTYKVVMRYGGSSVLNPSTGVRSFTIR